MQYYDDMVNLFVNNYAEGFPVDIAGLGVVDISGGAITGAATQPDNAPFIKLGFAGGATINQTIGTKDSILKSEPFNVSVDILIPKTQLGASSIYTLSTAATVERNVDAYMITDGFNASGETGVIYSDQAEPKFKDIEYATGDRTWHVVSIIYQYTYQYV